MPRCMTGTVGTEMIGDVPNQPKTPAHSVRIEPPLWAEVKKEAARRGETYSDVVRRALREHLNVEPEADES